MKGIKHKTLRLGLTCLKATLFHASLMICLCLPCIGKAEANRPTDTPPLTTLELHQFVTGAVRSVVLHEVAHALVDILDPIVTGPEEDVADEFATMLMLDEALRGFEDADAVVRASADAWLSKWRGMREDLRGGGYLRDIEYFSEHSLSPQRASNILCLLYGAFPESTYQTVDELFFEELSDIHDAPGVELWKERCTRDFPRKRHVWQRVLEPFASDTSFRFNRSNPNDFLIENASFGGPVFPNTSPDGRPSFRLEFEDFIRSEPRYYHNGILRPSLQRAVAHVSHRINIPIDVPVWFRECSSSGASYYPDSHQIEICHGLVDVLVDRFMLAKTGMSYEAWWTGARHRDLDIRLVGKWVQLSEDMHNHRYAANVSMLHSDGTFEKWVFDVVDGSIDERSGVLLKRDIWGFTRDAKDPNAGVLWSIGQRGLQTEAVVSALSEETISIILGIDYQRVE